jgi:hypothetical protein
MANKKISELPYINSSKISGNTLVPLVTYFSAATGDTVHTYANDLKSFITSGISVSGNFLPLSGGTVSGGTRFLSGLTATTISATTYQNLPTDIRVTGGTYSAGTISFTNNTGGTFNVTGLTTGSTSTVSGNFLPLSGGTVTGATNFTSGVTINSLTATTITNTYLDNFYIRDSGGTVSIDNTTRKLLKSDENPFHYRFLLIGGRKGHIASFDWKSKSLGFELQVQEKIFDLRV